MPTQNTKPQCWRNILISILAQYSANNIGTILVILANVATLPQYWRNVT